ncbi:hypothetical protein EYC80_006540 [Monilinia laxa]|uniref:Uncharacterized protein n=1 Tax=Monilinia laxa TaxID=61186 RepID=A0A5N6JT01_MONLA|nr:hypothetical protein EYC80_006540 [Monilinia laxa]
MIVIQKFFFALLAFITATTLAGPDWVARCAEVVPPGVFNIESKPLVEGRMSPSISHFKTIAEYNQLRDIYPTQNVTQRVRNHYNFPIWLEGQVLRGSGDVAIGDCPHSLHPLRLADVEKVRIDPGEGVMISNLGLFYSNGTYSGRITFHFGCETDGINCETEKLRDLGHGDLYSLFEWTTDADAWDRGYGPRRPGEALGLGYDVSFVDAQHLEMLVHYPDMKACAQPAGCTRPPTLGCPSANLRSYDDGKDTWSVCMSDCNLYKTDEACCRGKFQFSDRCTSSSAHMTVKCPEAFGWAYNDPEAFKNCKEQSEVYIEIGLKSEMEWWKKNPDETLRSENLKFFEDLN